MVGGSWTDKIMDVKSSAGQDNDGDGAGDDEWVRFSSLNSCLCSRVMISNCVWSLMFPF